VGLHEGNISVHRRQEIMRRRQEFFGSVNSAPYVGEIRIDES